MRSPSIVPPGQQLPQSAVGGITHNPSPTLLEKPGSSSCTAAEMNVETEVAVRMREQSLFLASVPSHRRHLLSTL